MELFAWFIDRLKETKDLDDRRLYDTCIVSYGSNLRAGHGFKAYLPSSPVVVQIASSMVATSSFQKKTPLSPTTGSPSSSRPT